MAVTSVTVSGDIGRFSAGEVLTSRKDIAEYYRVCLNEGAKNETNLTDEAILKIVDETDVGDAKPDDIDVLRTEAMEKATV